MQNDSSVLSVDCLVVGAGVIGSAIAMGLSENTTATLTVDLDLAGEWSSSELNAGGVRATWNQPLNVQISKHSIEYFIEHAESVGYRDVGYLWLHRPETFKAALKAREMQEGLGWRVDVLDCHQIQKQVPFIDKTDDLAGALFGVKDGLINPNRLKEHYREVAVKNGAQFMNGVWVAEASYQSTSHSWVIRAFQFSGELSSEQKKVLLVQGPESFSDQDGQWIQIRCKTVVNAAGAWAPRLAKILGYSCPSTPLRRQISLFQSRTVDLSAYGMIIDPSGVYFHPESIYGLAGFANPGEDTGYRFDYDGDSFFQEHIWAHLYERSTGFESLRHVNGWAGLYENSPDHNAIMGAAVGVDGVYEAHSFSGHGAMQSYTVGVELASLIQTGKFRDLDLSALGAERFTKTGESQVDLGQESWLI